MEQMRFKFFNLMSKLKGKTILIILPKWVDLPALLSSFALKLLLEQIPENNLKVDIITDDGIDHYKVNFSEKLSFVKGSVIIQTYQEYVEEYGNPDAVCFLDLVYPRQILVGRIDINFEILQKFKQMIVFNCFPGKLLEEKNRSVFSLSNVAGPAEIISEIFYKFLFQEDQKVIGFSFDEFKEQKEIFVRNFKTKKEVLLALYLSIWLKTNRFNVGAGSSLITAGKLKTYYGDLEKLHKIQNLF